MKILVTGGAGFIGSWVVDRLVEKGHEVVLIDNFSTGKKENLNKNANIYYLDICDHERLVEIFEKERPEIVFHLAAQVMLRKSIEDPLYDAKNNILGTISVLEACKKCNVRKIIYTSTGGARVGEPEYLPVGENHPLNPSSPYGISKHSAEHYVWTYNKLYGLDYLIFCFGNVYGPRDSAETKRLVPLFSDMMIKGQIPKIFGDGEQTRDFIYVLDLVDFIVESMDKSPNTKLFHLANGNQISINQMCNSLKEVSESNIEFEHVDAVPGEVRDIVLDISLARDELGWNPKTNIKEGLKETWDWFNNSKK
jgi:UDP-glucose 4-epimerase